MAKTVFHPNEIKDHPDEVMLKLVHEFAPVEDVKEEKAPEYTGPTADDLRREAEAYKKSWEIEKQKMLEDAQASADAIVKKAEEAAFAEVKRQTDQANIVRTDAEKTAEEIIKKAQEQADAGDDTDAVAFDQFTANPHAEGCDAAVDSEQKECQSDCD